MTKKLVATGTLECFGVKNVDEPDKSPPLPQPVQILIKFFSDRTQEISCPHIDTSNPWVDHCKVGPGEKKWFFGARSIGGNYHQAFPYCILNRKKE